MCKIPLKLFNHKLTKMKKTTILVVLMVFSLFSYGQSSVWKKADESKLTSLEKVRRSSTPTQYQLFNLDLVDFKKQLIGAPVRGEFTGRSNKLIYLPNANGTIERFYVMETPIMEKELAAKFPMIKSYAAQGVDNPTSVARFSVTQFGLHSMTFTSENNTMYIDPYTEDRQNYIVYSRDFLNKGDQSFECLAEADIHLPSLEGKSNPENTLLNADDKFLRTYRLAQSCTGEYGAIFAGTGTVAQQKANVQAQMAITMTRVNGVYEKDLAITMIFVANNDAIIYLNGTTDPWSGEYNTTTAQVIDAAIGFANYDIGHNFNTSGGGNAGCIGCVCSTSTAQNGNHKGRGFTGRSNPTGDAFDIDYVAHEMGHQFGGFHTQSSSGCRSGSGLTEVEPGSGSSIMGYAGICPANVQNSSDAYFTYVNIRDILLNVKSGVSSSCAQITPLTNSAPIVDAGRDYVIPQSTPFTLTAVGSDSDGDALTYNWEQNDPQNPNSAAAPTPTRTAGPMFRTFTGTTSPSRTFPRMATVLNGLTSNTWEVLPSINRSLNFSVTVRDNVAGGGQTSSDLMRVRVIAAAGPFVMTAPNTNVTFPPGTNQTITWNVAGTTANQINAQFVDIYFSADGGASFPTLLASKVPNDGSETITVPNSSGAANRIMVKAYDNIFFDVSNTNFTTPAAASTFAIAFSGIAGEQNKAICKGGTVTYTLPYTTLAGFSGNTTFAISGQPAGSTATVTPSLSAAGSVVVTVSNTASSPVGLANLVLTATSGSETKIVNLYLDLLESVFLPITLDAPENTSPSNVYLTWTSIAGATSYDLQIATDPAFTNIVESATPAESFYFASNLVSLTTYYWRVLPKNQACGGSYTNPSSFTTTFCGELASLNVPLAISATGTPTINSTLVVSAGQSVTINDLNVNINLTHSYVGDLSATLISPSGVQIPLFASVCGAAANINATFDDSGQAIVCGSPAINGTVASLTSLSIINGQSSEGTWTLRIIDGETGDGGQLNSWSLNFCSPNPPLGLAENQLKDFVVYPNPNSGNFNIQFNSTSSNDVNVTVFDMSGRKIFDNKYANQASFNQNIKLDNVQSGVYLLNVSDGDRKEVKRIIVK